MKSCSSCGIENLAESTVCAACGQPITANLSGQTINQVSADDLELEVSEAPGSNPEIVGMPPAKSEDDPIGVQSNADLMVDQGRPNNDGLQVSEGSSFGSHDLIGSSEPQLPEINTPIPTPPSSDEQPPEADNETNHLSEEQVKSIRKQLYGHGDNYIGNEEKMNLLNNMNSQSEPTPDQSSKPAATGFDNAPIVPPSKNKSSKPQPVPELTGDKPKMASRTRGIAYFAKNIIQISGEQEIFENDELSINDRLYILKKKHISSRNLIAIVAPIAAILVFWLGTAFTTDINTGTGQIVGLILNEQEQPYTLGTEVRIPSIGKSYRTNAQGFFKSDMIERGSYEIEYLLNGKVVFTDFATVVDGEVTTITMSPRPPVVKKSAPSKRAATKIVAKEPKAAKANSIETAAIKPENNEPVKRASAPKVTPAKIKLATNIRNATFRLDGKVLGSGNLTYTRIKPGKHDYEVSAKGFVPEAGSIEIKNGELFTLKINLDVLSDEQIAESMTSAEFIEAGRTALAASEYNDAILNFDKAVEKDPSSSDALFGLAEAKDRSGDKNGSLNDYIAAGINYRLKNNYKMAATCYSRALAIDDKSIEALLQRGSLYLARGEQLGALSDFETVKRLDRRNSRAYLGLGEARFEQGNYNKAIKHFKDAKSLDSKNPVIYQFLMLSYMAIDKEKDVRKAYNKFVKVANDEELRKFKANKKYSAVQSIINEEN